MDHKIYDTNSPPVPMFNLLGVLLYSVKNQKTFCNNILQTMLLNYVRQREVLIHEPNE